MPDPSLSPAIIEARAICPTNVFEIETLEIRHPNIVKKNENIDFAILLDITGSMSGSIANVRTSLQQVIPTVVENFKSVRFGVNTFKDENEVLFPLGFNFVTLTELDTYLGTVTTSGGGDSAEAGMKAVVDTVSSLPWNLNNVPILMLISDNVSHERGATYQQALDACLSISAFFIYIHVGSLRSIYGNLAVATNGVSIQYTTNNTILSQRITDAVLGLEVISSGIDSIFLVNDTRPHSLPIETGATANFETRGFKLRFAGSGENGLQNLSITIDDIDRKVSRFIALAKNFTSPVELVFRIYLSDDLTQQQNNPPTILYLTSTSNSSEGFSATATTIDVVNAPFPNAYYRLENFPLG